MTVDSRLSVFILFCFFLAMHIFNVLLIVHSFFFCLLNSWSFRKLEISVLFFFRTTISQWTFQVSISKVQLERPTSFIHFACTNRAALSWIFGALKRSLMFECCSFAQNVYRLLNHFSALQIASQETNCANETWSDYFRFVSFSLGIGRYNEVIPINGGHNASN